MMSVLHCTQNISDYAHHIIRRVIAHYRQLILRQAYDSLMISVKIFCKSRPRFSLLL